VPSGGTGTSHKAALIAAIVVVLALVVGGVAFLVASGGDEEASGEIFLEPANSVGDDPFSTDVETEDIDVVSMDVPKASSSGADESDDETVAITSEPGNEPGLYGGTQNSSRCDPQQLTDFLESHRDKARAWVDALNADSTLRWSGGSSIEIGDIGDYVDELTPITLISDTRVTNHGFKNGKATPREAVLEKGTAVLVDAYGVPRVKCKCGNPLTKPTPAKAKPKYTGTDWPDFSPASITVVTVVEVQIDVYVLRDYETGDLFQRPVGTTGDEDTVMEEDESPPTTEEDESPPTTQEDESPPTTEEDQAPPVSTQTGARNYCEALQFYVDSFENTDPNLTEQQVYDYVIDVFTDLNDLAPDEVADDWQTLYDAFVPALQSGSPDVFLDEQSPEVLAANDRITVHAQSECGINLDE
jgi:hypothetical protein